MDNQNHCFCCPDLVKGKKRLNWSPRCTVLSCAFFFPLTLARHHHHRDKLASPLGVELALAVNCAWLLSWTTAQYPVPAAPVRPPSMVLPSRPTPLRPLSIAESLYLTDRHTIAAPGMAIAQVEPGHGSIIAMVLGVLCRSLTTRLMTHLEATEQYRYVFPFAQGLLSGALAHQAATAEASRRRWQRLIIYSYISEARRIARQDTAGGEALFGQAVAAMKTWDTCLAPIRAKGGASGEGHEDDDIDPMDEAIPQHSDDICQIRLAHYVKAVSLLEQSLGMPGCPPRRLADLAYAGLRGVPVPGDDAELDSEGRGWIKWCHKHAASLWATVFRAGADHGPASSRALGGGSAMKEADGSLTDGAFEEAFLAMRAELTVAHTLEAMAEVEEAESMGQAPARRRRTKNSKLCYLITELCERGRIDLVSLYR